MTEGRSSTGPEVLRACALLSDAESASLERLAAAGSTIAVSARQTIIDKDEPGTDVYFLLDGQVRILDFNDRGRFISFGHLMTGDCFGELSAIDGKPRSATAATVQESQLFQVPANDFRAVIFDDRLVMERLLDRLAGIIRRGNARVADLSFLSSSQRICLELLRLAEEDPERQGGRRISPAPNQEAIASTVGVSRETVVRLFSRLQEAGIIERRDHNVYVPDSTRLEEVAMATSGG